ncbi:DUF2142 domain-containing protein [Flaviflexus huanghaiensis]|uniref:DUF2142 domain-containing protein n=1 Tax=Flaviflexus huanghaiensis TaxID=1111473 RepID=UPI0015F83F54|nr:DUF2142 domain-containing protein [Flaviflexus huanghaiensis]
MERRLFVSASALLTAIYLIFLITWAYATPTFRTPDAPAHYNSVMRLVGGGGWPAPGEATLDPTVLTIAVEGGLVPPGAPDLSIAHFYRLEGGIIEGNGSTFASVDPLHEVERSVPQFGGGGSVGVDQMTQHPPLYYGLAAGYLTLLGADSWQWDGQLLALRILSALMVMWVVPSAIATARTLGLGRRVSLAAGAAVFAVPQLAHTGSAVTNDSLFILSGALLTMACAKVLTRTPAARDVLLVGALLGLGLWTKATFIPFGLVVGFSFLFSHGAMPRTRKAVYAGAAGIVGLLIGGYWWVRNLVLYGTIQPAGYPNEATDWAGEDPDPVDFLTTALENLVGSFWGRFGWLELPMPPALVAGLTVIAAIMAIAGLRAAKGRRPALIVLTLFVPVTILVLLIQAWMNYLHTGNVAGMQGRYLFPAVSALAVLVAFGIVWLLRFGPWAARSGGALLSVVAPAVGFYGLWLMLGSSYPGESLLGFSWVRWDSWSIATGSTLKIWFGLSVLGSAAVAIGGILVAVFDFGSSDRAKSGLGMQGSGRNELT